MGQRGTGCLYAKLRTAGVTVGFHRFERERDGIRFNFQEDHSGIYGMDG